jgi:hypothetical protein
MEAAPILEPNIMEPRLLATSRRTAVPGSGSLSHCKVVSQRFSVGQEITSPYFALRLLVPINPSCPLSFVLELF